GALVGSRLFYFALFAPPIFFSNPLHIVFPFEFKGGFRFEAASEFSLTGGLIGFVTSLYIYSKLKAKSFSVSLNRALIVFIFISFFIEVGNFLQSENYGAPTNAFTG